MKEIRRRQRWAAAGAVAALAALAAACGGGTNTATVTAADYRYENLPKEVGAGTTLKLKNSSSRELHELVAVKLPPTETRSAEELVKLPEAQLEALLAGPPAAVLLAPPGGGETIKAVGDGTLAEPGRYLVICAVPVGADPAAYLQAAQSSGDGPPQVPGGGPPHFTQGMYGEITVK